jgi:WD40 repeat protein
MVTIFKIFWCLFFLLLFGEETQSQILIYGDHNIPVSGSVVTMCFSGDNRFLACGTQSGLVKLWDVEAKKQLYELKHGSPVSTVLIDSKGKYVISGGNNHIIIWDLYTGNSLKVMDDYKGKISHIALNPSENVICVTGSNKDISLYQFPEGNFIGFLRNGHTKEIVYSAFNITGDQLVSVGKDNQLILWDIATKRVLRKSEINPHTINESGIEVETAVVMPDRKKILIAYQETMLDKGGTSMIFKYNTAIYNLQSGILEKVIEGNVKNIKTIDISPDGSYFLTDNSTPRLKKINFRDIKIGDVAKTYQIEGDVSSLKISDKGDWLAVAEKNESSRSNEVMLFKVSGLAEFSKQTQDNSRTDIVSNNDAPKDININIPVLPLNINGKYYALIIGINDYEDPLIPSLDSPIKDAESIYDLLTSYYTFNKAEVQLLKNPKYHEIIEALDHLEKIVTSNDNLLIFYAGHGKWDKVTSRGYWLPSDARLSSTSNWFRNSTLTDYIASIKSKHTLLIADACFAGSIFKTRGVSDKPGGIERLYNKPSRKAMTSGTLEEVPDVSVFLKYLKKNLEQNKENFLPSEQLFYGMKSAVLNNSSNIPQFGEVKDAGDEGGDFIFVKRK